MTRAVQVSIPMWILAEEPARLQSRGGEHHSSLFGVFIVTGREWRRCKIAYLHPLVHRNRDCFGQLLRRQDRFVATFLAIPEKWSIGKQKSGRQRFGVHNTRMAATSYEASERT
jgi:hypothetical protein